MIKYIKTNQIDHPGVTPGKEYPIIGSESGRSFINDRGNYYHASLTNPDWEIVEREPLSRDECDDSGWTEWSGGTSPLPAGTRFVAEYRNGDVVEGNNPNMRFYSKPMWSHYGTETDIVAYKVVEND